MGRNISNFKSVPLLENILFLFFYFLNFPTYFFFAIIESYSNNKKLKQKTNSNIALMKFCYSFLYINHYSEY